MKLNEALQRAMIAVKNYIDKVTPAKLSDLEIDMELGIKSWDDLEDKPFYKIPIVEPIVDDTFIAESITNVTGTKTYQTVFLPEEVRFDYVDNIYTLTINENTYTLEAQEVQSENEDGSISYEILAYDDSYNVELAFQNKVQKYAVTTLNNLFAVGDSVYIKIEDTREYKIVTIDEEYIPDTIVRTSSVLSTANENSATESYFPTADSDLVTKAYTDGCENRPKNYTILTDEINGCDYVLRMRGGRLITYCMLSSIAIKTYPIKTIYIAGEPFDPTGITLTATYQDGTTKEITTGFTVDAQEVVNYGDTEIEFTVTYSAYDVTCTVTDKHQLEKTYTHTEFSIMKDFEYIDNGNGTYTLTDWKGTFDGHESTECIIPDDPNIIL